VSRIVDIEIRQLALPLIVPYKLSYRTFTEFEPYITIVKTDDGKTGFGEGHVSPGSSSETRGGAWSFLDERARQLIGLELAEAQANVDACIDSSPVAATSLMVAMEMIAGHSLLQDARAISFALLSPVNGSTAEELEPELEGRIADGFRTFKVKVGKDVEGDIKRLGLIQSIVGERATLRTDANRAYSVDDAISFANRINPDGVELFEQPCEAEDWDGNTAVASRSRVPVMLDEPICSAADIDRAAGIDGVGYCKVKLKRFGSIDRLHKALVQIRDRGMRPVLGDGLGAEVACWMEACIARDTVDNAGEFNGYLKPEGRIFDQPLGFENGSLNFPANYQPALDETRLNATTIARLSCS